METQLRPGAPPAAQQPVDPLGAPLLSVKDLQVVFDTDSGPVPALQGVTLDVRAGESLALVGESGSGKSVTARAIMGLLPASAKVSGSVEFEGEQLVGLGDRAMRTYRGRSLAIVFQDPMRSLNPTMRIGAQLCEAITVHGGVSRDAAKKRVLDLLERVRIPAAAQRFREYPHQLSGGMRQRVMIAMALSCNPKLVIADEPTTALDVTTQAQIMELLSELQQEFEMATILISHDLGLAAGFTRSVAVMYSGRIVEHAPTEQLFAAMRMPYTKALLDSIPRMDHPSLTPLPIIQGTPPDPRNRAPGCAFAPRCAYGQPDCLENRPPLIRDGAHEYACWHPLGAPGQSS